MGSLAPFDTEREEERARLAAWLAGGGVAALPTDTLPGLAASCAAGGAPAAAARIARLKGAPEDKPCALHLPDLAALREWCPTLPPGLTGWCERSLPGPWTLLLPARWVPRARDLGWTWPQVGLRVPAHAGFRSAARAAGAPLLLSSINAHGEEPLQGAALTAWLRAKQVPAARELGRAGAPSAVLAFNPLPQLLRGERPAAETRPGRRVLLVCSGNICRSPLAAALLKRELAAAWGVAESDLPALGWIVESAGTYAQSGLPASEHSAAAAQEVGLALDTHRARTLRQATAGAPPDLVFSMGRGHLAALLQAGLRAELFDPAGFEVADPFGGDLGAYRAAREQMTRAAQERVELWSRWSRERG